jgi:hypothetical protein
MAQAGVIRDFMVALGFKTDNSGLKQMQDAMGGVENKAAALKGALLALATGAVVAVRQTASELDKLYFISAYWCQCHQHQCIWQCDCSTWR